MDYYKKVLNEECGLFFLEDLFVAFGWKAI